MYTYFEKQISHKPLSDMTEPHTAGWIFELHYYRSLIWVWASEIFSEYLKIYCNSAGYTCLFATCPFCIHMSRGNRITGEVDRVFKKGSTVREGGEWASNCQV